MTAAAPPCPACAVTAHTRTDPCPRCGAPPATRHSLVPTILIVGFFAVWLVLIIGGFLAPPYEQNASGVPGMRGY